MKGVIHMVIGYARVSTDSQELNRQQDLIHKHGVDKLFAEKMTGTKRNRPQLNQLLETVRQGDTVVIESLSRLGRSTKDLLNLMGEFKSKGVKVISLKEDIDTDSPTGQLILTVLSAISQFERDVIVQRTKEGIQSAKDRGIKFGRPKADVRAIEKVLALYDTHSYSYREISELTGVSVSTIYRYLKDSNRI